MATKGNDPNSAVISELEAIKRLMVIALIKYGSTQDEIAAALGVTQGTVSKMVSAVPKKPKPKKG